MDAVRNQAISIMLQIISSAVQKHYHCACTLPDAARVGRRASGLLHFKDAQSQLIIKCFVNTISAEYSFVMACMTRYKMKHNTDRLLVEQQLQSTAVFHLQRLGPRSWKANAVGQVRAASRGPQSTYTVRLALD